MKKFLARVIHLFQRLLIEVCEYPQNLREFNFPVANAIFLNKLIPTGRSPSFISTIYNYLELETKPIWGKYHTLKNDGEKTFGKIPVWICWFQGEDAMPELVKTCFNSVQRNIPRNAEVQLVTLDNIADYVSIPDVITEKFQNGIISFAHYSDVLRYYLLRDYGGMWIDATIYVSSPIPEEWFYYDYYTMRMPSEMCPQEPCEGKWTSFCFSGKKKNMIFSYVCDALLFFLGKKNRIPDYIFLDYILMAGYRNIPEMKRQIDNVHENNKRIWALKNELSNGFDEEKYNEIISQNCFHKLAHQVKYPKVTEDGSQTFYGFIVEQEKREN